jgi:hypothetical protein
MVGLSGRILTPPPFEKDSGWRCPHRLGNGSGTATRALEFALFRTFCVPAISALLDKTQDFGKRAQKRYDDTDIIVSEMMEDATSCWPLDFRSHRLSCGAWWNCP